MKKGLEEKIDDLTVAVASLQGAVGGLQAEVGGLKGEMGGLKGEVGGLKSAVSRLEEGQDVLIVRTAAIEEYMQDELVTKKEFGSFRDEVFDHLDSHTHMLVRLDEERLVAHTQIMRIQDDVEVLKHK